LRKPTGWTCRSSSPRSESWSSATPGHRTAHATLLAAILDLLAGSGRHPPGQPAPLLEELSDAELRVVRYLPSNLKAPEIASELMLSLNTVRTHLRHIYAKLGAHSRSEGGRPGPRATAARTLGWLALSAHDRPQPLTASVSSLASSSVAGVSTRLTMCGFPSCLSITAASYFPIISADLVSRRSRDLSDYAARAARRTRKSSDHSKHVMTTHPLVAEALRRERIA
jgi:DNA-binding CsgD family transcriptional regulator